MNDIKLIEIEVGFENADIFNTYVKFKMTDGCVKVLNPDKNEVRKLVEKFGSDFLKLCCENEVKTNEKE